MRWIFELERLIATSGVQKKLNSSAFNFQAADFIFEKLP